MDRTHRDTNLLVSLLTDGPDPPRYHPACQLADRWTGPTAIPSCVLARWQMDRSHSDTSLRVSSLTDEPVRSRYHPACYLADRWTGPIAIPACVLARWQMDRSHPDTSLRVSLLSLRSMTRNVAGNTLFPGGRPACMSLLGVSLDSVLSKYRMTYFIYFTCSDQV
jgi:hypothetical protein